MKEDVEVFDGLFDLHPLGRHTYVTFKVYWQNNTILANYKQHFLVGEAFLLLEPGMWMLTRDQPRPGQSFRSR